jgi:hypothetical protein
VSATRLSFLALLLYVSLDFANPLMAGAVCFDPDRSVEGLARARSLLAAVVVLGGPAVLPAPPVDEPDPAVRPAPARDATRPDLGVRPRARAMLGPRPDAPGEDH